MKNKLHRQSDEAAREWFESIRWPNGPVCPHCDKTNIVRINGHSKDVRAGLLRCKDCRKQFTVSVGTIMERSHIPISLWADAIHRMCESKKGVSALQLSRELDTTYRT